MVDVSTESRAILHIINYLDWHREGYFTVDMQRAKLLDTLAQILEAMQSASGTSQSSRTILLGGETILLSDIASINDELLQALSQLDTDSTLTIGPWYIHLDSLLANGEALIRSLMLGKDDTDKYGIKQSRVALMPHNSQSVAQLPQILRQFGIDAVFMPTDKTVIPLPFNWQAPDGSSVLVMSYEVSDNIESSVKEQRQSQPDGPFLWLHRTVSPETFAIDNLDEAEDLETAFSTLVDFAQAVRDRLPDMFRPRLKGELHLLDMAKQSGRFSAHIAHKQEIMRLRAKLNHIAEPLWALSQVFGTPKFPEIQKSLLTYSWRLLLQNMSPYTFAGAVNDDVRDEMIIRNRQIDDNSQRVINKALQGLSGKPYTPQYASASTKETYVTVWNPHGHSVSQLVEIRLELPSGAYPSVLLAPDESEQPYTWDAEKQTIDFRADVQSVGFAVYTLKLSSDKTAAYNQKRPVAGRSIGSASGESLGLVGGRVDWTFASGNIIDLLNYYDGGDAGDVWQYQEPQPDVVMRGSIVDVVQVESTPTYERLIFRNRMRIAPNLKDGEGRVRGLRVLDLTTTATYHNGLPGIHFKTQFTNTAEDHRLRAHLRTGIDTTALYTDSAFDVVKRMLSEDQPNGILPMQSVTALYDNKRGLGLFTRGLPAIQPIHEDDQITLGLSLVRSISWLDKERKIQAQGAQMSGDFETEFMLMSLPVEHDQGALLRTGMTYQAPLRAFQYSEKPAKVAHSYLQIETKDVVMTTLKSPHQGTGLVVRLLNTSAETSDATIKVSGNLSNATRINFAESYETTLNAQNNQTQVTLKPSEITTIHLEL